LSAANLNAAFAALERQKPCAVLLDVQLGAEDGLSLVSWMRQQPKMCKIPIIAVTAQASVTDRQRILKCGCNAVVSKPIDFRVLQEQLQLWLSRAAASQETSPPGRMSCPS
jgi:DNA-binding response OmpR family regulator